MASHASVFGAAGGVKPSLVAARACVMVPRPNITLSDMLSLESVKMFLSKNKFKDDVLEQTEVQVKYSGYIEKEKANAEKLNNLENIKIPTNFNYSKVQSLSSEAIQKLNNIKPSTLSQASRISGVSPNDISVLMVYMGR